ncbi:unnamed protein product, partial [Ectocarpus fasciculatus]
VHQHDGQPQRVRHHGRGVRRARQRRGRRAGPAPPEDEKLHHQAPRGRGGRLHQDPHGPRSRRAAPERQPRECPPPIP